MLSKKDIMNILVKADLVNKEDWRYERYYGKKIVVNTEKREQKRLSIYQVIQSLADALHHVYEEDNTSNSVLKIGEKNDKK